MPKLEVNITQIEDLVKQLDGKAKKQLLQRIEAETIAREWDRLLTDIDKRLKKYPITEKEVFKEVEAVRKARYERSKGRRR